MIMKPGKFLCCMFLLAILGVRPCTNQAKIQKMVVCGHTTKQWKHYSLNHTKQPLPVQDTKGSFLKNLYILKCTDRKDVSI